MFKPKAIVIPVFTELYLYLLVSRLKEFRLTIPRKQADHRRRFKLEVKCPT